MIRLFEGMAFELLGVAESGADAVLGPVRAIYSEACPPG